MNAWGSGQVHDEGLTVGASAAAQPGVRARAVRAVCGLARDAADAALILSVLGLEPGEAKGEQG